MYTVYGFSPFFGARTAYVFFYCAYVFGGGRASLAEVHLRELVASSTEPSAPMNGRLMTTKQWYASLKKPRVRAAKRETKEQNTREKMEKRGEFVPLAAITTSGSAHNPSTRPCLPPGVSSRRCSCDA